MNIFFCLAKSCVRYLKRKACWLELAGRMPADCEISWNAEIWGSRDITVAGAVKIGHNAIISTAAGNCIPDMNRTRGYIRIGEYTQILPYAQIYSWGGSVTIGTNCALHPYTVLYGTGGIKIGNDVRIASGVKIIASMHKYDDPGIPIRKQGFTAEGITIEDDVWIGSEAVILDGVKIGRGAVIGANAVVTKDIGANSIAAGVPARIIKKRSF